MKSFLFFTILLFSFGTNAQCTISSNVSSSTLTCGTAPLSACNGILNIGNGTTPITFTMDSALDLSCLGSIQVIVNNAIINFQSGNNRLTFAEGSSIIFINGGTITDSSCNASERIYIGANLLATCNGNPSADLTFSQLISQGGTGSLTSNSPVCQGNTIIFSATPPPSNGPYTYSWSGPGLSATAYNSSSTYSLIATSSNSGVYSVKMKSSTAVITEALVTVVINTGASTATPVVSITQPTCTVATGTITVSSPTGTGMTYSINGITYSNTTGIFNSIAVGTYSTTAKNSSGCISPVTSVTINAKPATPVQPTLGTVTQPTCSLATGSFSITNYNASYTYAVTPTTGVTISGSTITAPAGSYTVTATLSPCTSIASNTATVNTQPAAPVQPTLGTVTQPTCTIATGSFSITNYNVSYTYTVTPSTGVTVSGSTITAPTGSYSVTATLGTCTSIASTSVTLNTQPSDTWNGTSWSTGFPPTSAQKIVFTNSYSSTSNLIGCACLISSGIVVINSGHTLTIINDVKVIAGSLTFEDGASLVQTNDAVVNSGNITYKRKTTALKQYDYTYWSSPVVSATLSQLATNSLFYNFNTTTNLYVAQSGATTMTQGIGYIGRAPSGLSYSPTQIVETIFIGVPSNGVFTIPIKKSTGTYNLIGNPYPSAIDADLFIGANTSATNGTIYSWTHNTAITNNSYTANDYAKYNYTGGVGTANPAVTGGVTPTGKIAAGQGFFIEAKTSLANGTYTAIFNDAMRITGNNTQFFRNSSPTTSTNSISEALERHRIWLSLRSSLGAYNQMLLGYVEGATNDFDSLFDGKTLAVGNTVSIYTMVGTDHLAIQGKSLPFTETDVMSIGYSTTLNGELSINLDDLDGLFNNQNVYLFDKSTNITTDLKATPYTFVTTSGTYDDRFELRFSNQALGTTIPTITDADIKIITTNNQLQILSPAISMLKLEVYDILGKLLFTQKDLNANLFQTNLLSIAPQMVLVKITLENQQIITKKALIQ